MFRSCSTKVRAVVLAVVVVVLSMGWWYANRAAVSQNKGGTVPDVDPETFASIQARGKPGILEFYTTTCPYCKMIEPVLSRISREYGSQIFVVKMNAEKYPQQAGKYQIPGVPTLVFFGASGEPKALAAGYREYESLLDILRGLELIR
ncbi:MAG: thioredoxin family protein [Candidatus Fermentithermobacillus carboniphilus]|uniref:Thioredoxin n=1 Tax=Candidatus Fermentithermobacillus carboniphilus TaxID=3085328 RepID=A0AAT9LB05_9FIRM|nr:MAG: thioredoxin family protein [Candidatus Fermentithermobacillus carboniphilus]